MLEKAGCIIFKDASANKGGVTSSSLEVLAALSMSGLFFFEISCNFFLDTEFAEHMKGGAAFYDDYVKDVHRVIEENARLEFECIWNEHAKGGVARFSIFHIYNISDLF